MKNFAIKGDLNEPLFREFIEWVNEKYNRGFIGIKGYYGINEGDAFHSILQPDEPLFSLEHWNEHIRNSEIKKIIGYRLIKPEYKEPASTIGGFSNFDTFEKFKTLTFPNIVEDYAQIAKELKEAGVLDLWFEPVYENIEPRLPQIAGYNGKIGITDVIYGCQKVPISLFDTKKCDLQTIKISGVTVSSKDIEQIRKVLLYGKFI